MKGLLKSPISNQQNSDDKSSTNNQPIQQQHIQWSKVQWHFLPGGTKEKYFLCEDCKYKTTSMVSLDLHVKEMHLISTTTHQTTNKEKRQFQCTQCPFKARHKRAFAQHNSCQRIQAAKYECPLCTFSVGKLCQLKQHLKLHSGDIDEDKSSNKIGEHQNAEKDGGKLPILSNNTNNTRSQSRMLRVPLLRTDSEGDDESRTRREQEKLTISPMDISISSNQSNAAHNKRKEQYSHCGQRKRYQCEVCYYQTASKVSMDLHNELMHSNISAEFHCALCPFKAQSEAALEQHAADYRYPMGVYSVDAVGRLIHRLKSHSRESIEANYDSDYRNAEKDGPTLPVFSISNTAGSESRMRKKFGVKECSVILHDIYSSSPKVVNPENVEVLPLQDADEIADVALEDGKIQSVKEQMKIMEERARITDDEVKEISSKKMDVCKRIIEMAGVRLRTEYDLRLEQCILLEMSISALDAEEDRSGLMEPVEHKVKSLEKKISAIDGKLEALKEEEKRLVQELQDAQSYHCRIVQEIEVLQSELYGLYHC